ncbi:MAG: HAD hydrolase family protein, partial [Polyangia bacterium]
MPSEEEAPKLQPLAAMPGSILVGLRVLAADIDDTITQGGKLPARTIELFEKLEDAGVVVALVTGRCAGWAQALAGYLRGVRVVVGENGLVCFDGAG